jgi:predicted nucleic acid-binding protein
MEINIKDATPKFNQMYFFDNNIWMFLFSPIGNYEKNKQSSISNFLVSLKTYNCDIVLNSLILSEFSNANLRLDFNLWKNETKNYSADFKRDYLISSRYKNTEQVIQSCINQILKLSERFPDNFNSINIENVLMNFKTIDFNDAYYLELCKQNNWFFVTDDNDFQKINHSVSIIKP